MIIARVCDTARAVVDPTEELVDRLVTRPIHQRPSVHHAVSKLSHLPVKSPRISLKSPTTKVYQTASPGRDPPETSETPEDRDRASHLSGSLNYAAQ